MSQKLAVSATKKRVKGKRMTQAERASVSDGRMIDAAIQLVLARGTHGTTLKAVGEKAGYSRGLAGIRFGSKAALFHEMSIHYDRRWNEEVEAFVGAKRGLAAFHAVIDAVEHFLESKQDHSRAMHLIYYETIGSNLLIRKRLASAHAAYNADVSRWISEAKLDGEVKSSISPSRFAVLWSSFVLGLIYQWLVSGREINTRQALKDIRVVYRNYLSGA